MTKQACSREIQIWCPEAEISTPWLCPHVNISTSRHHIWISHNKPATPVSCHNQWSLSSSIKLSQNTAICTIIYIFLSAFCLVDLQQNSPNSICHIFAFGGPALLARISIWPVTTTTTSTTKRSTANYLRSFRLVSHLNNL